MNTLTQNLLEETLRVLKENNDYLISHGIGQGVKRRSLWEQLKHLFVYRQWSRWEPIFYNSQGLMKWDDVLKELKNENRI